MPCLASILERDQSSSMFHFNWVDMDAIRLKKWADRLGPANPTLNIVIGSWDVEQGLQGWVEIDIPTSDCKLAGPDAAYIAEVIARLPLIIGIGFLYNLKGFIRDL